MVTTATPDEPVKLRLRESWVSRRGPEVGARGASERDAPGDEGAPFVAGATHLCGECDVSTAPSTDRREDALGSVSVGGGDDAARHRSLGQRSSQGVSHELCTH